jgi:hypothetical protein
MTTQSPLEHRRKLDKALWHLSWYTEQRPLESLYIFLPETRRPQGPQHYKPPILPATLSTAFFNSCASRTTLSFSSSAHSAMNVAVSPTNPKRTSVNTRKHGSRGDDAPTSLPPSAFHVSVAHANAKRRTRASSERVCMSRSRLRRLRRSEDALGRSAATESRQDTTRSRGVFGGVSEGAVVTGGGEGKCTAMGTWDSTCGRSADSLSSRQKTVKEGLGDVGGDRSTNVPPSSASRDFVNTEITPDHNAKSVEAVFDAELKDCSTSVRGRNSVDMYGFISPWG